MLWFFFILKKMFNACFQPHSSLFFLSAVFLPLRASFLPLPSPMMQLKDGEQIGGGGREGEQESGSAAMARPTCFPSLSSPPSSLPSRLSERDLTFIAFHQGLGTSLLFCSLMFSLRSVNCCSKIAKCTCLKLFVLILGE